MPIKYAVPAGSARTRVLTALAARYTGGTVRGWDVLDGLDTHPASQNSGRFGYPFGKTRGIVYQYGRCPAGVVVREHQGVGWRHPARRVEGCLRHEPELRMH